MRHPRPAVVIPTYNERDNIGALIGRIRTYIPAAEVIVVDDGSPDGTAGIVAAIARNDGLVELLSRPRRQGIGTAYVSGFRRALERGCTHVIQMDADHSHDPAMIPRLIAGLDAGAGMVCGSRQVPGGSTEGWSPVRRLISRTASGYLRRVLGITVKDVTTGFAGYRPDVLRAIDLDTVRSRHFLFQAEMKLRVIRGGFRLDELPIRFGPRRSGASKLNLAVVTEAVFGVWRLRRDILGRRMRGSRQTPRSG